VKPLMRAWLRAAWHFPRRRDFDLWEHRAALIRRLAPGKSFLDVGGMWNVHGRSSFLAEEAGAERVVLFDAMPSTEQFEATRESRGSSVTYVNGDLHDAAQIEELGRFDVVWCTGVVYHTPHPGLQVEHLGRMARERLVLGSQVIPEVPGLEQACVFYPGLSEDAREEFARAHGHPDHPRVGVTVPFDPGAGYANYWWGISRSALKGILEVGGFSVTEEHSPTPFLVDFVARPTPGGPR
jgi:hypothetical protein